MQTNNFTRNQTKKSQAKSTLDFSIINRKIKPSSTDFLKYLFLNEKNIDVTKNFLSSVMADVNLPKIKAVQIHSSQPFETKHNEIFNLNVLDAKGQNYHIEIMKYTQSGKPDEKVDKILEKLLSALGVSNKETYLAYQYIVKAECS